MFLAFGVEGDNTAIEQVKGDADTRVVLYAVPIVRMAVNVLKDYQGLFVALLKQAMVVGLDRHKSHVDIRGFIDHHSFAAACLQVITITQPVDDGGGLSFVDKPEIESSQLTTHPIIILSQLLIGIVWP